jgi:hypothetical protein
LETFNKLISENLAVQWANPHFIKTEKMEISSTWLLNSTLQDSKRHTFKNNKSHCLAYLYTEIEGDDEITLLHYFRLSNIVG